MKINPFNPSILKSFDIPAPVREFKFHPERWWKADFAWLNHKLIVEIEGGIWKHGRHVQGPGFIKDMEKYNAMVEEGWQLLRYLPGKVDYEQIKRVLYHLA